MLEGFQNINKAFESKVRLGVMAVLMVNDEADFNMLKELLSLTDGNLARFGGTRLYYLLENFCRAKDKNFFPGDTSRENSF